MHALALSGQDPKSGKFAYYVCQSVMKRGSGACDTPRLNARRFEEKVVGKIRENVLSPRGRAMSTEHVGGPGGSRTRDLLNAIEARSQLRHRPAGTEESLAGLVNKR